MGKKKQTIGYDYPLAIKFGLCRGPIDALLEMRAGDRTAFMGTVKASGIIPIRARDLFGGQKQEGGLDGELDVRFGEQTQEPDPYFNSVIGPRLSAERGKVTIGWLGGVWGSNNPYPKSPAFRVRRNFKGWDNDAPWYPEKLAVGGQSTPGAVVTGPSYLTPGSTGPGPYLTTDREGVPFAYRATEANTDTYIVAPGEYYTVSRYSEDLSELLDSTNIVCSASPVGIPSVTPVSVDADGWSLTSDGSSGNCELYHNGTMVAELRPHADSPSGWWYAESFYSPEYGGLVWHTDSSIILGVRKTGGSGFDWNSLIKWPKAAAGGDVVPAGTIVSGVSDETSGPRFWMHLSRGEIVRTINTTGEYVARDTSLAVIANPALPVDIGAVLDTDPWLFNGFGVDESLDLAAYAHSGNQLNVYRFSTGELLANYTLAGAGGSTSTAANCNTRIVFTDSSILVQRRAKLYRVSVIPPATPVVAMNAVHMLYFSLTSSDMQGEPVDLIDDANFRAAADRAFDEGFGLCTERDPATETIEDFQARIQAILGANLVQSRVDGKYRINLIRGDYVFDDLPVLTDDDILDFSYEDTDPNDAVNQLVVEWFDPIRKEKRTTPPLHALAAVEAAGGTIDDVSRYPEIPFEDLALRCGARDLRSKAIPIKRFDLTTNNRTPRYWTKGTFFRLQAPLHGFADMVCIVGELDAGTLRSGSMQLKAIQDVNRMDATVYVRPQPPIDTTPSQTPVEAPFQRVFEASYVELAGTLSAADLAAMAPDAGYLVSVAGEPTSGIRYDLWTAGEGADYAEAGTADWTPHATLNEPAGRFTTNFTLAQRSNLAQVEIGTAALWGTEEVRVDALDLGAGTITLARGCADTVPQAHVAGERLWFYDLERGYDAADYPAGEEVRAKLRTRTASQLLSLAAADELTVEMDARAARPYPPARFRINTEAEPANLWGELTAAWAHRDRVLQADQLVDNEAASIGPEPGTTYTVEWYLDDVLAHTDSAIAGTTVSYTPSADGTVRVEAYAVRDSLDSWQRQIREFTYTTTEPGALLLESGDHLLLEGGGYLLQE